MCDGVILVTGGTGFVGSHVVHALRAEDLQVRCLVRDPRRATQVRAWGCELAEGSMTDADGLRRAVEGCDTVVHLVAIRQGPREAFERVMVRGTRDLLAAAEAAGVRRFVHMSALGTTEATKDLVPYYGAKWAMEEAVRASQIESVIFRPSFVFGREGGILPTFRRLARIAPVTPIVGTGAQRIQPIWVDDVAAYFAAATREPRAANGEFDLGGPDVVSWNEFWVRLKRVLGVRRPSLHVPMALMRANALVTERLPGNIPLTRDLLTMLEAGDNVVSDARAVETFAIPLVPLDDQLRRAA
jgi:NADH dehydrogenase